MSDILASINPDDNAIIEAGYKPQLQRSLGFFSSFAISFSFMSVLMGIFANYGYVLTTSGPFGIWTWLLVGAGQFLVALVFAEMAARIPLTGALYNWTSRLANPAVSWMTAWMLFFAYTIGYAGVVVALFAPLQTFLGVTFDALTTRLIGTGIFVSLAAINIYGVQLASRANKFAVIAEIIALVVFGGILLTVIFIKGEANTVLLTTIPKTPNSYWPAFLMASLMAAWTIFGFESPADLSEETVAIRRIAPRSILYSVLASAAFGIGFLIIITMAIPDVAMVTAAADPISAIVTYHLGGNVNKIFLVFVLVAMLASSLIGITAASRILFAVARDKRIVGSSLLARISAHQVPKISILVVAGVQIVSFLLFENGSNIYAAAVVLLSLAYLTTVISFAVGIKKLPAAEGFSLGRWRPLVVVLAIVWLVCEIGILTIPAEFHAVAVIAASIVVGGGMLYFLAGLRNKKAA